MSSTPTVAASQQQQQQRYVAPGDYVAVLGGAAGSGVRSGAREATAEPAGVLPGSTGVYTRGDACFASVVGQVRTTRLPAADAQRQQVVEVVARCSGAKGGPRRQAGPALLVPETGAQVLCRVLRVNPRQATVTIVRINGRDARADFRGVIRQQNVRAREVDSVDVVQLFRPGDVVAAEVISLGDRRSYYLSTAEDGLGVVRRRLAPA